MEQHLLVYGEPRYCDAAAVSLRGLKKEFHSRSLSQCLRQLHTTRRPTATTSPLSLIACIIFIVIALFLCSALLARSESLQFSFILVALILYRFLLSFAYASHLVVIVAPSDNRYLTNEIQRKIKKHRNYLLVLNHMEKRWVHFVLSSKVVRGDLWHECDYNGLGSSAAVSSLARNVMMNDDNVSLFFFSYLPATADDLSQNSDNCAICWEKMDSARKLPCSHLFHK